MLDEHGGRLLQTDHVAQDAREGRLYFPQPGMHSIPPFQNLFTALSTLEELHVGVRAMGR